MTAVNTDKVQVKDNSKNIIKKPEDAKIAKSSIRMVKSSIKKIAPFARAIKGLSFKNARIQAQFQKGKIPTVFLNLLNAAAATAENDKNIDSDSLIVREILIGKDKTLKRIMPRGRGRTAPILKRYSRITLIMESK
jgi:large subunit ribosomal protein L22